MPPNPSASSAKSMPPLARATVSPRFADGTPKNQAPGTLKAKGEPARLAATPMKIVPKRPAHTGWP